MAAISITVKNNLYTIELDAWDWTGLTVNGTAIRPVDHPDGYVWTYTQQTEGFLDFTATAQYVTAVNPGNHFVMKGDGSSDHMCNISYADDPSTEIFNLYGVLANVSKRPSAEPGPFPFNQGKMTGTYQHG
jgi:hypothetical protein